MSSLPTLELGTLASAVKSAVAIRVNQTLQPAGGPGSKVFPPTYVGDANKDHGDTRYATELRRVDGQDVLCVLLDSVASQANRMEEALLDSWLDGLEFPLVRVDFTSVDDQLEAPVGTLSTLEMPHRIYDAILRDSVDANGVLFRYSTAGEAITRATPRDATALYTYCPAALVFGAWDSTGPKGGLGSKFQRAISSEIVAVGVQTGTKVGGRLDPLGIVKKAGPVFEAEGEDGWATENPGKAKELHPSDINHGNIAPSRDAEAGGVTFDHALQTAVLSLPALRRLRFAKDVSGADHADPAAAQNAARVSLAALGLAGLAGAHAQGHDLRSGALLVADGPLTLEIVGAEGQVTGTYTLSLDGAERLVRDAAAAAGAVGMGWQREPVPSLRPAPKLVQLLAKSQKLEAKDPKAAEES